MDFFETLSTRRSIRRHQDRPVEDEKLRAIRGQDYYLADCGIAAQS